MSRYIVKFRESAVKAGSGNQQVTVVDSMGVFRAGCSGSNPIYIYNLYIHECMHVHAHIVQLESRQVHNYFSPTWGIAYSSNASGLTSK